MVSGKKKSHIGWIIAVILAIFWLLVAFVPFMFMVLTGFKEKLEVILGGALAFPKSLYLDNYISIITDLAFWNYFKNSVIVLILALFFLLLFSAFAAYPLSRFKFNHVTMIPVFQMAISTHMYDTIWILIPTAVAFAMPISVFIMTGFMQGIPKELEESADIDGCGRYLRFFRIILPLSTPGLSTLAIYNGVNIWNEFIFAFTLTQSEKNRTLPLALWNYQGQYSSNTAMIMACLTLSVLPMIIMFCILQDKLVKGMMAGAVKG